MVHVLKLGAATATATGANAEKIPACFLAFLSTNRHQMRRIYYTKLKKNCLRTNRNQVSLIIGKKTRVKKGEPLC